MLRVVSNLAIIVSPKFRAAGVYFAHPTIAIAKIRDYSQSTQSTFISGFVTVLLLITSKA